MHGDYLSTMATTEQDFCALKQTQPRQVLEKIFEWKGMGENLLNSLVDCFSDIEAREQALKLGRESLEKRVKDLEKREKKFDLFEEERKGELMLREENLDEQLKLVREHIERLEAEQGKIEGFRNRKYCERLKEIENREREIDVVRGSIEKRSCEIEKREKEFEMFYNGKLGELDLREEKLRKEKKHLSKEVKVVNENLKKKQKAGCDLIEKLESALNLLKKMKAEVDERFKEMESCESKAQEYLTAKLNEADLIKESLEKRFEELEKIDKEINLFQEAKTQELESKEQQLRTMRLDLFKGVKLRQEQLSKEQKLVEHMVSKKLNEIESLDGSPKDVGLSRQSSNNQEPKQSGLPEARNAHSTHECVDLENALQKNARILEMFINRTEEDLELMDDEIFKVLLLSSDPAKFVLEAVDGLYTSKLGKESEESKCRRVCILLLDQLTKWCPIIQPSVRGEAFKLALEWMPNLNTSDENPLEVLVFLHLLAAYNLSSSFEKDELFGFAKLVVQHKQTPQLCRVLGLAEKIPDIIQNLIHEKQYLLASVYTCEFKLENMFPQAAVLDYYVKHSKVLAKKTFEAQEEAAASEIADLRAGIEHIIKYGLESVYSTHILIERIKQLERNQASFKCRSSSGDVQKPGKGKRSWGAYRMDVQQTQQGERRYFSPWKAQNLQSRRDEHPYTSPGGFYLSRSQRKRRRKAYDSFHDGKSYFD